MTVQFTKATKEKAKLRLALIGPSGAGKTFTALTVATKLGSKVALIDTESGSASKYAGSSGFAFDKLELTSFEPEKYIEAIRAAEKEYDVVVIDSLSHAWAGPGGILEFVDQQKANAKNQWTGPWGKATPRHNELIQALVNCKIHLIATMRSKVEYILVKNEQGREAPQRVGMQPIQREGMEYEFDVVGDLDQDNTFTISKSRILPPIKPVWRKPGEDFASALTTWLNDGAPATEKPEQPENLPESRASVQPKPAPPEWWAHYGTLCKFNKVSQEDVAEHLGVEKATGAAIQKYIKVFQTVNEGASDEGAIAHLVGEIAAKRLEVPA